MKRYISFNHQGTPRSNCSTLAEAIATPMVNLVVEVDDQFVPHSVSDAWSLGAYPNRSAEWFRASPEWAEKVIAQNRIRVGVLPPPSFRVGAYIPQGESDPVLVPMVDHAQVGPVYRVGEPIYGILRQMCAGCPDIWLFGTEPRQL